MKKKVSLMAVAFGLGLILFVSNSYGSPTDCEILRLALLPRFSNGAQMVQTLDVLQPDLATQELRESYCRYLISSISRRLNRNNAGACKLDSKVVDHELRFEHFRIQTFISSGVAPKKYFGFFDEQCDTAEYERIFRKTVIDAVALTNRYAEKIGLSLRLSEKEVAITFLSEGGALALTAPEYTVNSIHPVRGIGLDDFRLGFKRFSGLVDEFDQHFGTKLNYILISILGKKILLRTMTFREAILGTSLMYLFEKEIAEKKLRNAGRESLNQLDLTDQFIVTSLVYNSGILFSADRVRQIRDFSTAQYLADVIQENQKTKGHLNVFNSAASQRWFEQKADFPKQLTSWNAVYHILQRYGAWVAIEKFSDTFTSDGSFRERGSELQLDS